MKALMLYRKLVTNLVSAQSITKIFLLRHFSEYILFVVLRIIKLECDPNIYICRTVNSDSTLQW